MSKKRDLFSGGLHFFGFKQKVSLSLFCWYLGKHDIICHYFSLTETSDFSYSWMLQSQLEMTVKPHVETVCHLNLFSEMLLRWKLILQSYAKLFYSNFWKCLHVMKNVCYHLLDVIRSDVWLCTKQTNMKSFLLLHQNLKLLH